MIDTGFTLLLWIGAIGCGMMAGLYFAFSTFVMKALSRMPAAAGAMAMQSINRVILRSPFMPLFFVTTAISIALVAAVFYVWSTDVAWTAFGPAMFAAPTVWSAADMSVAGSVVAAGLVYFVGMFLCTGLFNVPLNVELDAVDPASREGALVWRDYVRQWTWWNHIRALSSGLACLLFIYAISAG